MTKEGLTGAVFPSFINSNVPLPAPTPLVAFPPALPISSDPRLHKPSTTTTAITTTASACLHHHHHHRHSSLPAVIFTLPIFSAAFQDYLFKLGGAVIDHPSKLQYLMPPDIIRSFLCGGKWMEVQWILRAWATDSRQTRRERAAKPPCLARGARTDVANETSL
ncbi:hypothetical protein E2C01_050655 [Portunus trituberculatus]|uniref:Uncharacterized protein n=1 Tax=Portunus trituberculatus TaxID=210409 RepID=A0A5B7G8V9_PORTR|nr:hypothetical protein [Portunus trituberculatus]